MDLLPRGLDPSSLLPDGPLGSANLLTYDEQLNFFARQPCAHYPVLIDPRADTRIPFLDPLWRDFILGIPWSLRVGKVLYKAVVQQAFPRMMQLPLKGVPTHASAWGSYKARQAFRLGRMIRRRFPRLVLSEDPMANYIDFDHALRHRDDVRGLVHDALRSLRRRGVVDWLDLPRIWSRHIRSVANHGDALTVLTALDLNLEAAEREGRR